MIRNIVFDMGNVLLRFDPEYFITRAGITEEEDRRIIRNELFQSVEWALMDLGFLTEDTAEPAILSRVPDRLKGTVSDLLRNWAMAREMVPGMEELARSLKKAGYGIYLLSNASVSQHVYWPRLPISRIFDGKLISCDVKVVKPSPEIYRLFLERFSLKAEECVFIDDSIANAAAAVACGWQAIVFHGEAEEAQRKLREMGVRGI